MTTKYTPAPWVAELLNEGQSNECWRIGNADAGNDIVAECIDYVSDPSERDANALLVAAAPMLFEALERLEKNGYLDDLPNSIVNEVYAALRVAQPNYRANTNKTAGSFNQSNVAAPSLQVALTLNGFFVAKGKK